jgi:glutamine synthetase
MSREKEASEFIKFIDKEGIRFVDFRFTDITGAWHHTTYTREGLNISSFQDGILFDGSSIRGWRSIHQSDMIMRPDLSTAYRDIFYDHPTLALVCDIIDPHTNKAYDRDPRSVAEKASSYLKESGIANNAFFGPELEFFIFDQVEYGSNPYESFYSLHSSEAAAQPNNENVWHGYTQKPKKGYFPLPPLDSLHNIRSHIVENLSSVGITPLLHHHEVAVSQVEIGFLYDTLLKTADNVQKYKHTVKNTALLHHKTASFMPKPIQDDNGTGMHIHMSLWDNKTPLFSGDRYADLSPLCLSFIGGIIHHAKALNAFTNSTTNSYRRLIPGFEAPTLLAYSAHNRSASIRIPHVFNTKAKRIEVRFPDGMINPYLAFSALLMAGIDGIKNKRDPGEASDHNLYELSEKELGSIPKIASSLKEALEALDKDRSFLTQGDVFSDALIDSYITLKNEEVLALSKAPTPLEFELYFTQ